LKRYTRRPLPSYRHRPGLTPHPERDPEGHLYGRAEPLALALTRESWLRNEDYLFAVDLFNEGYYWEAHVFWERLWALPETEPELRPRLQGLIQVAAACLKRVQVAPAGARRLLHRAEDNLGEGTSLGIDAARLRSDARAFIDSGGAPPVIDLGI
jgi:hypothetical protein